MCDDSRMARLGGVLLVLVAGAALADDSLVTFTASQTTAPLAYVEYLPPGYSTSSQPEALVLFFHGMGESGPGTDATSVFNALTAHGPLQQVRSAGTGAHRFQSTHRAIVLAPRNPSGLWNATLASQFFTWARGRYRVDADRLYLTGLSAGGGPSWTIPKDHPGLVAATVPICPVQQVWPVTANDAVDYRHVAVWAFHGFGDPMVPREESVRWVNAIGQALSRDPLQASVMTSYPGVGGQSAGSDQTATWTPGGFVWRSGVGAMGASPLRYTLLDRNDHFIWDGVYSNGDVWNWLFAQRRSLNVDPGADGGVPRSDAGVDAGAVADAGAVTPMDAGAPVPDAGAPGVDAGGSDAGVAPVDAGEPSVDAGVVEPDAGVREADGGVDDAGAPLDAGSMMAGVPDDAGTVPPEASAAIGGCGCGATAPLPALLVVLAFVARRQRRPSPSRSLMPPGLSGPS